MDDSEGGKPTHSAPDPGWEREKHEAHLAAIHRLTDELAAQRKEGGAAEQKKAFREKVTIVLVGFTLLATGVGDVIFGITMDDARKAASKAHGDNVAALNSARTGAYIQHWETSEALKRADAANSISRDTAARQLRAYVYVMPDAPSNIGGGQKPIWGVSVYATGQTPAYNLKSRTYIGILSYPVPDLRRAEKGSKKFTATGSETFPNTPIRQDVEYDKTLTSEEFYILMHSKIQRLYTWGHVKYTDAFHAPHYKDFCFSYDFEAKTGPSSFTCGVGSGSDGDPGERK